MIEDYVSVIGDVHGDACRLSAALDAIPPDRTCVLVGDYINRGPNSREVLDILVAEKRERGGALIALRGNHEQVLLNLLSASSIDNEQAFLRHGGLHTLADYGSWRPTDSLADLVESLVPSSHLEFLRATVTHYETEQILITHAGWDPHDPHGRSTSQVVFPPRDARLLFDPQVPTPKSLAVFGHYVQQAGQPYWREDRICLDSGCGAIPGAPLSVAVLPERLLLQF